MTCDNQVAAAFGLLGARFPLSAAKRLNKISPEIRDQSFNADPIFQQLAN